MTKRELNRDIRRLYKKFSQSSVDDWGSDGPIKAEFKRLWYPSRDGVWVGFKEFKMMLIMNRSLQVIPNHLVASHLKI